MLWPWLFQELIIPSHAQSNQIQYNLNIHQDRNYLHQSQIIKFIALNVIKVVLIHHPHHDKNPHDQSPMYLLPFFQAQLVLPTSLKGKLVKTNSFSEFPRSKSSRLWSLPSPPRSHKEKHGPEHHRQDHLEVVEGHEELRIAILVAGCGEKVFPGSPSGWEHSYKWYAWSWSWSKGKKA